MCKDGHVEKKTRAIFMAAVEKAISKQTVVILDFLNTIKGFRYELYCRARSASTQHCVVFCDVTPETARAWNETIDEKERYPSAILDDLVQRLEVPNGSSRWDSPLFVVKEEDKSPPLEQIATSIIHGKAPVASFSTVPQKLEAPNFVYDLDRITQDIVKTLSQAQSTDTFSIGDTIKVPHTTSQVILTRKLPPLELSRIRRQYLKLCQLRTPGSLEEIALGFVDVINSNVQ